MRAYGGIIPGIFTMGNLFCGFASILTSIRGSNAVEAAWLIVFAAFFDFLDGLAARLSGSASRFGVELDSLCDIISFGLAPAILLYSFHMLEFGTWGWILGFLFVSAGAYRLARYNLTARLETKRNFIGLPIPAAALTLVSFVLFTESLPGDYRVDRLFSVMLVFFSALMVSTIEYETITTFDLSNRRSRLKMLILVAAAAAILVKAKLILFPVMVIYVSSGVIRLVVGLLSTRVRKDLIAPRNIFRERKKNAGGDANGHV